MKKNLLLFAIVALSQVAVKAQFTSGSLFAVGTTGVSVKIDTTPTLVTLTLAGPSNSFLGIGAGDSGMAAGADGFIYSSAPSRDYTFQGIGITPEPDANQDWTVTSNTVSGSTRTIVATRSITGSPEDTVIPNAAGPIDIFVARGNNTLTLSYHGAGNRDYATLVMSGSLATGETGMKNNLQLYPNPSKGVVFVKYTGKIKQISLYDVTGKKVMSPQMDNDQINISKLSSGTYFFEIENENGEKVLEKVIKQ